MTDYPVMLFRSFSDIVISGSDTNATSNDPALRGCLKRSSSSATRTAIEDDAESTSSSTSGTSQTQHQHEKHVSFDSIQIIEFPLELGDNPAVREEQRKVLAIEKLLHDLVILIMMSPPFCFSPLCTGS
jgi:hypothetical protein